ncbi:MAG: zf-HC2 domain-containing protein [Planctomycetes bacterium]|nr:zf-HC2 domain-containing protein [Planctomycetota bacterium]
MAETAVDTAGTCARYQEDIPMLAVGALSPEETEALQKHLQSCAACRQVYENNRGVLELVRQESSPSVMLNSRRVLEAMKKRMAEESRSVYEPAPALTAKARIYWLAGLAGVAAAACIAIALLIAPDDGKHIPVIPGDPDRIAVGEAQPAGAAKPRPVFKGDRIKAEATGARVSYATGMDCRLRQDAELFCVSVSAVELADGVSAFYVPPGIEGFQVRGRESNTTASAQTGARFMLRVSGKNGEDIVQVAEGSVDVRGKAGAAVRVYAGSGTRVPAAGTPDAPEPIDVVAEFGWVGNQSSKNLACEFKASEYPTPGGIWTGTLALRNTGERALTVAGYHPLGSNYQLEIRKEGEKSSSFTKIAPRQLSKRSASGNAEPVMETSSEVTLEPGQSYELEVDLRTLVKEGGPYTVAAHYQVFSQPKASGAESKWGFALRSDAAKVFAPLPKPEHKAP